MINSLKTIAFFECSITADYHRDFCRDINIAAKDLGYNILYFNFLGDISPRVSDYGANELKILDIVPFGELDGIIYDEDGFNAEGVSDAIYNEITNRAECPVIMMNNIWQKRSLTVDETYGIKEMVRHFVNVHGFDRIGFMCGPFDRADALGRLDAFRSAMKECGLPEEGVGVFEGDFWFNKGDAAAEFFSSEEHKAQAVVCANDFMAMSLCNGFKKLGLMVPEDVCVSGFDGVDEGQEFIPRLSTVDRLGAQIARRMINKGRGGERELYNPPQHIRRQLRLLQDGLP
ncbi:MAG: LacI family DNA-binding transcriptional regulator [Ruminococcus sp.]|nr:LacI family DNA-binding transcriptional regulator [Ruminococcus sp.]